MSQQVISRFSELSLSPAILQAVADIGYETPSPIQAQSIPPLLEGRDLLGTAQTGTGKTAAFALPLLSRLDISRNQPQLLVLAPTRELAIQVAEAMQAYARHMQGFHILPVYGGQGMDTQLRQLKRGVHVVVGTPGRVQDHLRRGTLKLDSIRAVVLDEADEMLRMGFIDDVEAILQHTPADKQVALFSATMPPAIKRVADTYLRNPVEIKIKSQTTTVSAITQRYWQVSGIHKLDALTRMLEVEEFDGVIIFVRTKNATIELAEKLEARGYSASPLNGDMSQQLREKTVDRLKKGSLDILVGTDVVARGLDVERISHVINYDIPYDTESYVHRIGRTGRAGRKGDAILFVAPREKRMLSTIEKATGQKIEPMQLPSRETIANKRVMAFKQLISDAIESQELAYFQEIVEGYQEEHNIGMSEVAAALAYLLQKDRPLAPEFTDVVESAPPRKDKRDRDSYGSGDRGERSERSGGNKFKSQQQAEAGMARYRIEVGRQHGAEPKHIVGAIANEAGVESAFIRNITIHDDYSTVDLPEGMPNDIFQHLRKVRVASRMLNISLADGGSPRSHAGKPKPKGPRPPNKGGNSKAKPRPKNKDSKPKG
ncbi:MAG: DEAD/DEAH box helicase [Gammaproteobacteria bacterium]|nr:DEAD/DEAH box helicase [Gammaproteobacteria bacterium]